MCLCGACTAPFTYAHVASYTYMPIIYEEIMVKRLIWYNQLGYFNIH